jgi:hypothetical protein
MARSDRHEAPPGGKKSTPPFTAGESRVRKESAKTKEKRDKDSLKSASKKRGSPNPAKNFPSPTCNSLVLNIQDHIDAVCGRNGSHLMTSNEGADGLRPNDKQQMPRAHGDHEEHPVHIMETQKRNAVQCPHIGMCLECPGHYSIRDKEMLALKELVEQSQLMLIEAECRASMIEVMLCSWVLSIHCSFLILQMCICKHA